jgi:hypothetical protein
MVMFAKRKLLLAGCVLETVLLCGCLQLRQAGERAAPPPLPAAVRASFEGPPLASYRTEQAEVESGSHYRRIRFTLVPEDPGRSNVVFDYFPIPGERNPVILILPISGGSRYPVEEIFAHHFIRNGFATIIAHRWRVPHEFELGAMDGWLRRSVTANQLVLDWIETRPELDTNRIGLFGISLGGIRGVLLTALDERIKAAALGLAGGDLPTILTQSADRGVVRRRDRILETREWTLAQLEADLRESITCEPNDFARHIDPQRVLLVLGCFDRVVPYAQGRSLREHLGKPETMLLPTGHYSAVLAIPAIQMRSVEFFEIRMGIGPSASERRRAHSPRDAP